MSKRYYTLRYEHTDALHKAGDMLANADNVLHIGQAEGCDVRLPNVSQYEDAEWAVIERVEGADEWKLIRTSPYREHEVRVNGMPVTYVHFLQKGDCISFEGLRQELLFDIREDDLYTSTGIMPTPRRSRVGVIWMSLLSAALMAIGAYLFVSRPMTDDMIDAAKQSVLQIKVDSICLICVQGGDTTVAASCRTDIGGVAFLTTDSLLVTARHCIEPWLNIPDTLTLDTLTTEPEFVRMALKAETLNSLGEDDCQWQVVSYCSLWQTQPNLSYLFSATSQEFCMDKSRDLVMELGDYDHYYVWRSISARPRRTDMMLGDIACMKVTTALMENPCGSIRLAKPQEMQRLCGKAGRDLVILGSPVATLDGHDIEISRDELRRPLRFTEDGRPETVLSHNGEIAPGFSGGPVLTKCGVMDWCAVGVISATDRKNANRCYSVPVTELDVCSHNQKNMP